MQLQVRGKLDNIFKRPDFTDKENGEVKTGKYQLEFISQREVSKGSGFQTVVDRISIPDHLYDQYKDKIGKDVIVNVDLMVLNKRAILYGVE